jgi:hypothetical protein
MNVSQRSAVIVAGMHRSGTSATTHALSLLGGDLPLRLMGAHETNPLGHFEPEVIVQLHDAFLKSLGSSWSDWKTLPHDWMRSAQYQAFKPQFIEEFDKDFGQSPLPVLKDPRLCRMMPLWQDIMAHFDRAAFYVLPFRNPIAVANSIVPLHGIDTFHAYMLWLRHLIDAEHASRGKPRVFVCYETLLADPMATMQRLATACPFNSSLNLERIFPAIVDTIKPAYRHHEARDDDLLDRETIPLWLRETYSSYRALEQRPDDPVALRRLDAVRDAFNRSVQISDLEATARSESSAAELNDGIQELQLLNLRLHQIRADLAGGGPGGPTVVVPDNEPKRDRINSPNDELRQQSSLIGYLYAVLDQHAAVLAKTNEALAGHMKGAAIARRRLATELKQNEIMREHLDESQKETERLQQLLLLKQEEAKAKQEELEDIRQRRIVSQEEGERLREIISSLEMKLEEQMAEIDIVRGSFLNSRSWRLTKPARWLKTTFTRALR